MVCVLSFLVYECNNVSSQVPHVNATVGILVETMVAVKKMLLGIIAVPAKEDSQVLSHTCIVYIMYVTTFCTQ
jgi:hypothetical protein